MIENESISEKIHYFDTVLTFFKYTWDILTVSWVEIIEKRAGYLGKGA